MERVNMTIISSDNFLAESGISFEPSAPYSQDQNGVSARMMRTIIKTARPTLHDAILPYSFWDEPGKPRSISPLEPLKETPHLFRFILNRGSTAALLGPI